MLGLDLVRPLEADWRDAIDDVARQSGWPTTRDVAKLASRVKSLSDSYNDPLRARAATESDGAARLGFFFARDVPKTAAAVRELVATGALRIDGVLRVLDLGAGMGASTWGIVRALEAAGEQGTVEATWVDADRKALDVGAALARRRPQRRGVALRIEVNAGPVTALGALGAFDVVVASGLLSELDVGASEPLRVERHAALLSHVLETRTSARGSLVVVEPALRDRARHLHAVRDALVSSPSSPRTVFAPCLHESPCPALGRTSDWCHDDLPIALPPWLVPVARTAGLRYEGLTLAYLVLRKDGVRLVDALVGPIGATRARAVSESMRTKGKREVFLCGAFLASSEQTSAVAAARVRTARLDRDRTESNEAWDGVERGDVLVLGPPVCSATARIGRSTEVRLMEGKTRR
jgi:ribosomal protein RSM22 (predicted rRNA methylase)